MGFHSSFFSFLPGYGVSSGFGLTQPHLNPNPTAAPAVVKTPGAQGSIRGPHYVRRSRQNLQPPPSVQRRFRLNEAGRVEVLQKDGTYKVLPKYIGGGAGTDPSLVAQPRWDRDLGQGKVLQRLKDWQQGGFKPVAMAEILRDFTEPKLTPLLLQSLDDFEKKNGLEQVGTSQSVSLRPREGEVSFETSLGRVSASTLPVDGQKNDDAFALWEEGLAVMDGVSSSKNGSKAAALTGRLIRNFLMEKLSFSEAFALADQVIQQVFPYDYGHADGTSTLVAARLHRRNDKTYLELGNAGDSIGMVLRPNADGNYRVVAETEEHSQLAMLKGSRHKISVQERLDVSAQKIERGIGFGKSQAAMVLGPDNKPEIEVREGDIVILASDALTGNLTNEEILAVVSDSNPKDAETIQKNLRRAVTEKCLAALEAYDAHHRTVWEVFKQPKNPQLRSLSLAPSFSVEGSDVYVEGRPVGTLNQKRMTVDFRSGGSCRLEDYLYYPHPFLPGHVIYGNAKVARREGDFLKIVDAYKADDLTVAVLTVGQDGGSPFTGEPKAMEGPVKTMSRALNVSHPDLAPLITGIKKVGDVYVVKKDVPVDYGPVVVPDYADASGSTKIFEFFRFDEAGRLAPALNEDLVRALDLKKMDYDFSKKRSFFVKRESFHEPAPPPMLADVYEFSDALGWTARVLVTYADLKMRERAEAMVISQLEKLSVETLEGKIHQLLFAYDRFRGEHVAGAAPKGEMEGKQRTVVEVFWSTKFYGMEQTLAHELGHVLHFQEDYEAKMAIASELDRRETGHETITDYAATHWIENLAESSSHYLTEDVDGHGFPWRMRFIQSLLDATQEPVPERAAPKPPQFRLNPQGRVEARQKDGTYKVLPKYIGGGVNLTPVELKLQQVKQKHAHNEDFVDRLNLWGATHFHPAYLAETIRDFDFEGAAGLLESSLDGYEWRHGLERVGTAPPGFEPREGEASVTDSSGLVTGSTQSKDGWKNDDAFALWEEGLAVADGVSRSLHGGHAAALAARLIRCFLREGWMLNAAFTLVHEVCKKIHPFNEDGDNGITTLVAARQRVIGGIQFLDLGNVGDSLGLVLRPRTDGSVDILDETEEQSVLAEQKGGRRQLTLSDRLTQLAHTLSSAIGHKRNLKLDARSLRVQEGDIVLLASDAIGTLTFAEILEVVQASNPRDAVTIRKNLERSILQKSQIAADAALMYARTLDEIRAQVPLLRDEGENRRFLLSQAPDFEVDGEGNLYRQGEKIGRLSLRNEIFYPLSGDAAYLDHAIYFPHASLPPDHFISGDGSLLHRVGGELFLRDVYINDDTTVVVKVIGKPREEALVPEDDFRGETTVSEVDWGE